MPTHRFSPLNEIIQSRAYKSRDISSERTGCASHVAARADESWLDNRLQPVKRTKPIRGTAGSFCLPNGMRMKASASVSGSRDMLRHIGPTGPARQ